jgi:hypothetical protein
MLSEGQKSRLIFAMMCMKVSAAAITACGCMQLLSLPRNTTTMYSTCILLNQSPGIEGLIVIHDILHNVALHLLAASAYVACNMPYAFISLSSDATLHQQPHQHAPRSSNCLTHHLPRCGAVCCCRTTT